MGIKANPCGQGKNEKPEHLKHGIIHFFTYSLGKAAL